MLPSFLDVTYVSADGTRINLNDRRNTFLMSGVAGDLMPVFKLNEQQSPSFDGSIIDDVTIEPRDITIPIYIQDDSRAAVLERVRSILKSLSPKKGEGKLIFNSDGVVREINCRYESGLQDDGTQNAQLTKWMKAMFMFRACDPYFYDPNLTSVDIYSTPATVSFFPIPPMALYNPHVFCGGSNPVVVNDGEPAWPIITIQGPGDDPSIQNLTSGKKIGFSCTLGAADKIIIDTSPLKKTVVDQNGVNLWPIMDADSALFPLLEGNNTLEIYLRNFTSGTKVTLSYKLTYLTL